MNGRARLSWVAVLALIMGTACAEPARYGFSVLNQRSPALSAEYWNPILAYVSRKAGIDLKLKMGRTVSETTALTVKGDAHFAFTTHLFTPERVKLGWKVIARPDTAGIRGQLVVPADSAINRLEDLNRQSVAFPSPEAFVGFRVPMDIIQRTGVKVNAVFAGNQEGAIGQLMFGRVAAAAVNEDIVAAFSKRERFRYRVLWSSDRYKDVPILASPRVPEEKVRAVRQALAGMMADAEGKAILERGARLLRLEKPVGFVAATDAEYKNYRDFHRAAMLKD